MISTARGVHRDLRSSRPEEVQPGWLQDVLQSIRWMHREHVKDLRELGYSPKEAFWLDFACLPFLPWEKTSGPEIRLSLILGLYADIHRSTVGPLQPSDARAFLDLLKQRYHAIGQHVAAAQTTASPAEPARAAVGLDPSICTDKGPPKWALGGLIVMRTAREWRQHRSTFPCRLVEDI